MSSLVGILAQLHRAQDEGTWFEPPGAGEGLAPGWLKSSLTPSHISDQSTSRHVMGVSQLTNEG